jgi:hypothetical protein
MDAYAISAARVIEKFGVINSTYFYPFSIKGAK